MYRNSEDDYPSPPNNEAMLSYLGYDTGYGDPGPTEDYEPPPWKPLPLAMARFRMRDLELAMGNVALATANAAMRHKVVITNGLDPGHGYGAIAVIVGGPEPGDCLHSLGTFGSAAYSLRSTPEQEPETEPITLRVPKAA